MDPERWQQLGELLHRTLEKSPSQRAAYLESACGDDVELRREVESLIAASGQTDLILDKPLFERPNGGLPALAPGQTIGQYEILERIGEGGMGMVFKARDQKLGRTVALKTLHPRIGSSPDGRRRFVQEARAASALNRPNIITIYDLLEHNGVEIIVMEYVEGHSLEQMLASRALPLAQLYKIGIQVAEALAAAHIAGIVHRDLKPANILVGTDGLVKVVDFGIAKLTEAAAVAAGGETQTISRPEPTQGGMIVGTAAYMSPEQAEAQSVDARSDIFSFGSVLYEMATGRRAFPGESVLSTLSAVLRDDPTPVREIAPTVPPELARIISRCLRKDPARRFQGMADLRVALEDCRDEAEAARSSGAAVAAVTSRPTARLWATIALMVVGLVLGAVSSYLLLWPGNMPSATMRPLATETSQSESPSWSPDGKVLAYVARSDSDSRLMARAVDAATPAQLAIARGTLFNLVWSRDATRIYYLSRSRMTTPTLWSVGAAGGAPRKERDLVTAADLSPDGRTFAVVEAHKTHGELWLGALDGPGRHRYAAGPFDDSWHFLASPGAGQILVRFAPDGSKLLVTFTPVGTGDEQGAGTIHNEIWIVPYPTGNPHRVLTSFIASSTLHDVQWMPDSRHLVLSVVREAGFPHILLADSRSGRGIQLTSTPLAESELAVRPDGKSIAFESVTGSADLIEVPLDGGPARPLLDSAPFRVCSNAWLLSGEGGEGGYDVGVVFSGTEGLIAELRNRRIYRNEVNRLVLVAHGARGAFWITRQPADDNLNDYDNPDLPEGRSSYFSTQYGWTFRNLNESVILHQLHLVGHYLHNRSEVIFLGCDAGLDPPGDLFLTMLSTVWPGVKVIGFPVIISAIGNQTLRPGGDPRACMPPGMVVTAATGSLGARRYDVPEPLGYRLNSAVNQAHPWANSSHPLAKIAQYGRIIHAPSAH